MTRRTTLYTAAALCALLVASCADDDRIATVPGASAPGRPIVVGGVRTTGTATVTRAEAGDDLDESVERIDGDKVPWLVGPLEKGLDVTYGWSQDPATTERVAVLKLLKNADGSIKYVTDTDEATGETTSLADYSFLYRDETDGHETDLPGLWCGNGAHYFEGIYVPQRIKESDANKPADLTTDQHGDKSESADDHDSGNYTLLEHYLAMPPNCQINATVGRIKLPLRHRLARVLAYILIDPLMEGDVTIKGYTKAADGKEDATTSDIRFCNVGVLSGVKDVYDASKQHHTYIPQWTKVRKAVPHFVGEFGSYSEAKNEELSTNFIAYYDAHKKEYIFPTDDHWATAHALTYEKDAKTGVETSKDGAYTRTVYGRVPVYDLIVQPTYSELENVMYDEDGFSVASKKQDLYVATNQIDFEITLSNGLNYTKKFVFDLDANYETVVYLRISRERVDYNSSGSELWQETRKDDGYYGVNNQNGNTLSFAGSGWQRAYTNTSFNPGITDGHYYQQDSEDKYAQYVDDATWIEMFLEAKEGDKHHGDYFILDHDLSITIPDGFVFTGHLDGQDHTLTLSQPLAGLNGNYRTSQESNMETKTWEANVHQEIYKDGTKYWVPYRTETDGWRAELINTNFKGVTQLFTDEATVTGYVHNCWLNSAYDSTTKKWSGGTKVPDRTPSLPEY